MKISFPESKSGQAIISAIAIASIKKGITTKSSSSFISGLSCENCKEQSWLDIGQQQYGNGAIQVNALPSNLFGADWIQLNNTNTHTNCALIGCSPRKGNKSWSSFSLLVLSFAPVPA